MDPLAFATPHRYSQVRLLADNESAWLAKRHLIVNARQTLDLSYFILEVDSSTSRLMLDLVEAAARGVQVRLLVDYFTTFQQAAALRALGQVPGLTVRRYGLPTPTWLAALQAAGIDARAFVTGLVSANAPMLAASLKGNSLFAPAVAGELQSIPHEAHESGIGFPIQVLGALMPQRDDPADAAAGAAVDRDAALGKVALLIQIVRGLKQFLHRSHHKLLLADGRWFVMGGRNLADAYHRARPPAGQLFQDTDLMARDDHADGSPHRATFETLWNSALTADIDVPDPLDLRAAEPLDTFRKLARQVPATPHSQSFDGGTPLPNMDGELADNLPSDKGDTTITRTYIAHIQRLQSTRRHATIDIVSAYLFLADEDSVGPSLGALRSTLMGAAAAGLTVNIYTNSLASTDLKPVNRAAYPNLVALIEAGVNVFELADGQGSLHTKAAAIGDDGLIVGSYNMDPRSELYDTNNLIVLADPTGEATAAFRRTRIDALGWSRLTADAARAQADAARTSRSASLTHGLL